MNKTANNKSKNGMEEIEETIVINSEEEFEKVYGKTLDLTEVLDITNEEGSDKNG